MARRTYSQSYLFPLLLIFMGIIFLLRNSGYVDLGELISRYWPLILIFVGLRILWYRRGTTENKSQLFGMQQIESYGSVSDKKGNDTATQQSKKSVENIFGDIRLDLHKQVIESFRTSNIFGNVELNFSQASFKNPSSIRINGVFGNVNISMPADIYAEVKVNYIGGSSQIFEEYHSGLFKNISYQSSDRDKTKSTVMVEISIVFGDIRIFHSAQP